jgi:hypothetical protein
MPSPFRGSGPNIRLAFCIVLVTLWAESLNGDLNLSKEFGMSLENGARQFRKSPQDTGS